MDWTSAAYFGDRLRMTATRQRKNMLMPDSGDTVSGDGMLGARDTLYGIPDAARTTRSWGTFNASVGVTTVSRLSACYADSVAAAWLARGAGWRGLCGARNLRSVDKRANFRAQGACERHRRRREAGGSVTYRGLGVGVSAGRTGSDSRMSKSSPAWLRSLPASRGTRCRECIRDSLKHVGICVSC